MSQSYWEAGEPLLQQASLQEDAAAQVCVIGAGISGLTTAYMLARLGLTVIVLDDGPVGGGETKNTTAHLTLIPDALFYELERLHGRRNASLAVRSHGAAIDTIEALALAEGISCDFTRVDAWVSGQRRRLLRELAAAHRAGVTADLVEAGPWGEPALLFPRQAQLHPLKYIRGLARCLARDGVRIYGDTHVTSISGGSPARVETKDATVAADHVVVATNSPVNDRVTIHTKQVSYRSYVLAARLRGGAPPPALYYDLGEAYHYVRLHGSTLIVGGEDHKTGQADDGAERFERLEAWARERFPIEAVERRWSGQVIETLDRLAFIGRNPTGAPNVYIATGDCGQGMTHGTLAGLILSDLITGRPNEWAPLYDPSRKPFRAALEYAKQNLNSAVQYTDWLTSGEVASVDDIPPGQGAIVRRGIHKVAVYRDESGHLHERSARCPHLGAVVGWNPAEGCWDCPAHGSRFSPTGEVLNGPAISNLKRYDDTIIDGFDVTEPPPPEPPPQTYKM